MRSTELKVNITVEEVLAGEATGEHFTLQMAGVISPLLTGKPTQLQVSNYQILIRIKIMSYM